MRDFSSLDSDARVAESAAQRASEIKRGIAGRVAVFQKVYCDLGTAQNANNAFKISVPFRSVFVRSATDSGAVVYLAPNENAIGNIAEALPLYKNDSFDFGITMAGAFLWWPAQAGKVIELYVSTEGRMQTGSQISQIAGGLSVSDGSTITSNVLGSAGDQAKLSITAATMVLPADTDRKKGTIYIDGPCWGGDAGVEVGARGVLFPAGLITVSNTAAFYLAPVAGTVNVFGNVEK